MVGGFIMYFTWVKMTFSCNDDFFFLLASLSLDRDNIYLWGELNCFVGDYGILMYNTTINIWVSRSARSGPKQTIAWAAHQLPKAVMEQEQTFLESLEP